MAGEDDYIRKFCKAGYFGPDDVEHLNRITKEELINDIGVYKKGTSLFIMEQAGACMSLY